MTLVLSAARGNWTVQASDRTLSTAAGPFDIWANKCVLVKTLRGIASIAYTGPAFLYAQRVDHILAEAAAGKRLDGGRMTLGIGAPIPSLGQVLLRIRKRLWSSHAWVRRNGTVVVTGQQWHFTRSAMRERSEDGSFPVREIRPVIYTLEGAEGRLMSHVPREERTSSVLTMHGSGVDSLTTEERTYLHWKVSEIAPHDCSAVAMLLVSVIRRVSERRADVGGDCMVFCSRGPQHTDCGYMEWRPKAGSPWADGQSSSEATFTPWVLESASALPPSRVTGSPMLLNGWDIEYWGSYAPPLNENGLIDLKDLDISPVAGQTPKGYRPQHGAWRAPPPDGSTQRGDVPSGGWKDDSEGIRTE